MRTRPALLALLLALAASVAAQAIQDSRCYLMNGGAVESFFISEDTAVGSVIGVLSVNGDPRETGDITLSVQEKRAAVGVAPGTKNVTLLRPLDREERLGPASVYVNVRCDRRRTNDPSFVIPVSVRVWDVNDEAPVWSASTYRARVSELSAAGARVLAAAARDADQPGPHAAVRYSVLPGPYSDHFEFPNELEGVLVLRKPLDFETVRNVTVRMRAQDQGTPPLHADATLAVDVLDADDQNPRFTHEHYTAVIPDDAEEGTILETSPGPVAAVDQDVGINAPLQYAVAGEQPPPVLVDRDTGRLAATARLLRAALPLTVVIRATQVDNQDRYALCTVRIGRAVGTGASATAGVRFSRGAYVVSVREDTAPGGTLATLGTDPPRHPRDSGLQFFVSDRSFLDKFAINSHGEVLLRRQLDYETQDAYYYQVMVTDGVANDTASLNITVVNVNEWEPRFRYPQYEFRVEESPGPGPGPGLVPVGKLDVHDGDSPDTVSLTLRGSDASMFYINDAGEMFMRQEALPALNSSVLHVVATAVDSGTPPRQTSVPVIVHVSPALLTRTARSTPVLAVFAAALALLALLVMALLGYIYRYKRRTKASASPASKQGFVSQSPPRPTPPSGSAGSMTALPPLGASSGSLLSVSAGASTILANSSSSLDLRGDTLPTATSPARNATVGRQSQRFPNKSKVAPMPPSSPGVGAGGSGPGVTGVGGVALMSDHVSSGAAGRSGVAWPAATIPARVKKLSWDDADPAPRDPPDKDSAVGREGRALDAANGALHDHLNLTVYF